MIPEEFGTEEFWDHYNRLLKGRVETPSKRTFEGLALSYFEGDGWEPWPDDMGQVRSCVSAPCPSGV